MLTQVQPVLPSQDVEASIDFYVRRLGFALAFQDAESPTYAGVRRNGVELHFQWHDPSEWSRIERPMLRFVVSDLDGLFEELKSKDIFDQNTAIRTTPWGTREFAFFDPDKNGLTFYVDS
jgi:catechol 2,3-dioxygenase-like lactoylglutathione lyase family enzyme